MGLIESFVAELDMEGATTRRVLERVPDAHLAWKPHAKSSSLGQLALHVATIPEQLSGFVSGDSFDFSSADTRQRAPESSADIVTAFERSQAAARAYFASLDDARAGATWTLMLGGKGVMAAPRAAVIRSFLFNHLYHHRGQILVYLRLLDVSVPSVYGPTADENPFAAAM